MEGSILKLMQEAGSLLPQDAAKELLNRRKHHGCSTSGDSHSDQTIRGLNSKFLAEHSKIHRLLINMQ